MAVSFAELPDLRIDTLYQPWGVSSRAVAYIKNLMMNVFNASTGMPWSAIDDDDLRTEILTGAPHEEVSAFLCRTPDEVAVRAAILGLRWHAPLH
jgi:hypothetical protein